MRHARTLLRSRGSRRGTNRWSNMVAILANPKWSEDLTIQMIIEYEKREYLWNPVSENYKNKKVREQGYVEIIKTLNLVDITVKELKNKIKNIRSSYSVELKKIRAARKAGAHAYRPSVTWFEHADRFLRAIVTPSSVSASAYTHSCGSHMRSGDLTSKRHFLCFRSTTACSRSR